MSRRQQIDRRGSQRPLDGGHQLWRFDDSCLGGALCPVGAFYSVLGRFSIARVSAVNREQCNDCTDCFKVCPEPHVLKRPVYGADKGASRIVLSPNCTNCGRCIDVCTEDVFRFTTRLVGARQTHSNLAKESQS